MRKRYRVLLIAALAAALVVPVGYALSLESQPPALLARTELSKATASTVVASPVLVHPGVATIGAAATNLSPLAAVPDAGKFFLVGTMLFGLSALVRKAI